MQYEKLYQDLIDRMLKGKGDSALEQRQAAFNNAGLKGPLASLIGKVANDAYKVTDNDVASAKAAGNNEDQLFELIICGAAGQASRQYQSGLTALAEATKEGGRHAS